MILLVAQHCIYECSMMYFVTHVVEYLFIVLLCLYIVLLPASTIAWISVERQVTFPLGQSLQNGIIQSKVIKFIKRLSMPIAKLLY